MKNIVILQKDEDGNIQCAQITEEGKKYVDDQDLDEGYWEDGGTIVLEELNEILDREI